MKEATGEANMTIVTVVLIGIVSAVAAILIPNIMTSVKKKSCCTAQGGEMSNGECVGSGVSTSEWKACYSNEKIEKSN